MRVMSGSRVLALEGPGDIRLSERNGANDLAQADTILRMTAPIGREAQRLNPALTPRAPLLGDWRTTGTHPLVPGTTFHGRTSFSWHKGGAFVVMRSEIDEPEIPSAVAVIGSDDAAGASARLPDRPRRRTVSA